MSVDLSLFEQQGCKVDTGYDLDVLQQIFDDQHSHSGSAPGSFGGALPAKLTKQAAYFYCYYMWIHKGIHPKWKEAWTMPKFPSLKMSERTFDRRVLPIGIALKQMNYIEYDRRLDEYNHAPHFADRVTSIVDTMPVKVPAPTSYRLRKLLWNPKYGCCVLKIQVGITLKGEIVLWTGPHLGVTADKVIWDSTFDLHPLEDWELWLADLAYIGCRGIMTKFKGKDLTEEQQIFSNIHEHIRNRVENVISAIKVPHAMFRPGAYRRALKHLTAMLHVVGHTTALQLNRRQRFETFGPWPHGPARA